MNFMVRIPLATAEVGNVVAKKVLLAKNALGARTP
jgi:hypothetical protein